MHLGIIIAIVLGVLLYFVLYHTSFGFRTRMVGANPEAAHYAAVNVKSSLFVTFLIVGGFSGLVGAVEILGFKHSLYDQFSGGMGYETITVALLGGVNPLGVIASSFFFGGLRAGGNLMQQTVGVPTSMVQVIQSLAVLFLVGFGITKPKPKKQPKSSKQLMETEQTKGT
jgi:simple sugar transport system permease protein